MMSHRKSVTKLHNIGGQNPGASDILYLEVSSLDWL